MFVICYTISALFDLILEIYCPKQCMSVYTHVAIIRPDADLEIAVKNVINNQETSNYRTMKIVCVCVFFFLFSLATIVCDSYHRKQLFPPICHFRKKNRNISFVPQNH